MCHSLQRLRPLHLRLQIQQFIVIFSYRQSCSKTGGRWAVWCRRSCGSRPFRLSRRCQLPQPRLHLTPTPGLQTAGQGPARRPGASLKEAAAHPTALKRPQRPGLRLAATTAAAATTSTRCWRCTSWCSTAGSPSGRTSGPAAARWCCTYPSTAPGARPTTACRCGAVLVFFKFVHTCVPQILSCILNSDIQLHVTAGSPPAPCTLPAASGVTFCPAAAAHMPHNLVCRSSARRGGRAPFCCRAATRSRGSAARRPSACTSSVAAMYARTSGGGRACSAATPMPAPWPSRTPTFTLSAVSRSALSPALVAANITQIAPVQLSMFTVQRFLRADSQQGARYLPLVTIAACLQARS